MVLKGALAFMQHFKFKNWTIRLLCGRHVIRKAIWRISKLEIWNLKSAVSALCGSLSFACFEKKWGKVSWIFRNSSIQQITNTFSYDMPTTLNLLDPQWCLYPSQLLQGIRAMHNRHLNSLQPQQLVPFRMVRWSPDIPRVRQVQMDKIPNKEKRLSS